MIELDLSREPYSRRGSYFSILQITGDWAPLGKGLYIQTHHSGQQQIFKVNPVRGRRRAAFTINATPLGVTLECKGGGAVTICIAPMETIRIRCEGVGVQLESPPLRWCYAYALPGDVWAIYNSPSKWTFALQCLRGDLAMDIPWVQRESFCKESGRIAAFCAPDADGIAELAIDEFETSHVKCKKPAFSKCQADIRRQYTRWCKGVPAASQEMAETRDRAAYVNWASTLKPCGYLKRETMLMSKAGMCNVYGWDHAFNAMAHVKHDSDLAWDQLMVMSDQQDQYGKVPDHINDQCMAMSFGKPPVHGWAARYMMQANPRMFTTDRLQELYNYLSAVSTWFLNHRTWDGDLLPFYSHGFDSGWDNSTIFDQGVPLISPDLAAFLALQLDVVGDLATQLELRQKADMWHKLSRDMVSRLIETLWRDNQFVGLKKPEDRIVSCQSMITCMPIVLGDRLPVEIRNALVEKVKTFVTKQGLATEHPDSPEYMVNGYWRGPIWAPSTLLILSGLKTAGEHELAKTISLKFMDMCTKSGFAENFDALNGKGHFCPSYTWTSSVFMILAEEYA